MVHTKKFHDVIGHVIQQPYCFFFVLFSPSKIFSETPEKIEVKLYTYDRLSMTNKRVTHMTSYVTWFGSHIGFT